MNGYGEWSIEHTPAWYSESFRFGVGSTGMEQLECRGSETRESPLELECEHTAVAHDLLVELAGLSGGNGHGGKRALPLALRLGAAQAFN